MNNLIKNMLSDIKKLNHSERILLKKSLNDINDFKKVCDLIESIQEKDNHCPHCGKREIYKHGTSASLQRYKCMSCNKTFNSLTGTPLARLRKKELWLQYLKYMLESKTLRYIEKELEIDKKTAFLWRHRFTKNLKNDIPKKLEGIVEADETYFRFSKKGCRKLKRKAHKRGRDKAKRGLSKEKVCVVVACDRFKNDIEVVAGFGTAKSKCLNRLLQGKIASDAVLVTDGLKSYNYFCSENNIAHEVVKNKKGKRSRGCYHIQNVNSYHARLKSWIIGVFHGVSTKYLNHYLWWRHELENKKVKDSIGLFKLTIEIPQLNGT